VFDHDNRVLGEKPSRSQRIEQAAGEPALIGGVGKDPPKLRRPRQMVKHTNRVVVEYVNSIIDCEVAHILANRVHSGDGIVDDDSTRSAAGQRFEGKATGPGAKIEDPGFRRRWAENTEQRLAHSIRRRPRRPPSDST
jgi:hypothetical protein